VNEQVDEQEPKNRFDGKIAAKFVEILKLQAIITVV
jgi:hypothetical protein